MNINFTARFLCNAPVLKSSSNAGYQRADLSLVELDNKDTSDMEALKNTTDIWTKMGAKYARSIYFEATNDIYLESVDKEHYFAITEQKSDFSNLVPNQILGLMVFDETNYNSNEITLLEVKPNMTRKNKKDRIYKNVGSNLVNYVQKNFNPKNIIVFSDEDAIEFYKKNGFKNMYDNSDCQLYWEA